MRDGYEFPFEKLRVWQKSREWIGSLYRLTKQFPRSEAFNLVSQLNRASVSVAANLAEGSVRSSFKDQAHFSNLAYGSLMESACLCILANDLGYISGEELAEERLKISGIANQINALRNAQLKSAE